MAVAAMFLFPGNKSGGTGGLPRSAEVAELETNSMDFLEVRGE